jgi:hypothetical protein
MFGFCPLRAVHVHHVGLFNAYSSNAAALALRRLSINLPAAEVHVKQPAAALDLYAAAVLLTLAAELNSSLRAHALCYAVLWC